MNDQIICPNCKKAIPLSDALSHQIQEKYQRFYKQRLSEEVAKKELILKEQLTKKIREDMDMELKDRKNELEELRGQNSKMQEQLLEFNKMIRHLKLENERRQIELEKKLTEEQDKIREEEKSRLSEEYKLRLLEKDKKITDAWKLVEEYKRKLEQGSQQLQGEIYELELENILKREFPLDEIKPVPKGVKGADVFQIVRNSYGRSCGTIIWESKRTKTWSPEWITKLKEDQRGMKAEIAVIISQILPEGIKDIGLEKGVWVGSFDSIISLSLLLRAALIEVAAVKLSNINRQSKMEVLYNYFSGIEFKQRLEAVIEAFNTVQEDIEKEKRWFTSKWAKQEKSIRNVFDNISGMYGDLQSVMGKSLPEVKGLDLLPTTMQEEIEV